MFYGCIERKTSFDFVSIRASEATSVMLGGPMQSGIFYA